MAKAVTIMIGRFHSAPIIKQQCVYFARSGCAQKLSRCLTIGMSFMSEFVFMTEA